MDIVILVLAGGLELKIRWFEPLRDPLKKFSSAITFYYFYCVFCIFELFSDKVNRLPAMMSGMFTAKRLKLISKFAKEYT